MFYQREGQGAPLVLLHGFCSSSEIWRPTLARLSRDFDIIAPDWPGFGRSTQLPPCRTVAGFGQRLLALADQLGLDDFHVLGHSMSGFVVQHLLCTHGHRVRKAVLYGAGTHIDSKRRFESAQQSMQRLQADGAQRTAERVISTWFPDGALSPAYRDCVRAAEGMTVEAGCLAIAAMQAVNLSSDLVRVQTPALVMLGENDHTHPPSMGLELGAALPRSSLCILPRCGHAAHLEQPDLFHTIAAQFLLSA